ncbi:MAG TPA: aminotransferase class I/II-fold pyridoxal phosphate-dependent enzyme [Rudaea sp.]|jgi:cystathionine gamma-synthase|nr:aminotransferase class I/II-fold pyridoxal phosphate-dependent enzyme [Rudaea sp.]
MRIETLAVHAGCEPDQETGAMAPPIHLATTFKHGPAGERIGGYEYTREDNPTQSRLETALAALEGGAAALAFASGMAAIDAAFSVLMDGSRIIVPRNVYMGVRALASDFLAPRIDVDTIDTSDLNAITTAMTPQTRLVWLETPSNPLLQISDIAAIVAIAHKNNALVAVDNTFATPCLQRPLALGADIVMHSTTKYFGGHSDVLGGALVFARRDETHERIAHARHVRGAVLSPFNAWLTLRGCRSMPARMAWHCRNGRAVAEFLAQHPRVERVNWPGLASHPNHDVAARQMSDFGAMLSVQIKGGRDATLDVAGKLKLFTNATSLGGCESLVEHRESVEGANPVSPDNLLRVSVGLEHPDDLIADWKQALT